MENPTIHVKLINAAARGPFVHIVNGVGDGPVTVQRDGTQVKDGRGAAQNVQSYEQITGLLTQSPLVQDLRAAMGRTRTDTIRSVTANEPIK